MFKQTQYILDWDAGWFDLSDHITYGGVSLGQVIA
jgi:hypothetical protein